MNNTLIVEDTTETREWLEATLKAAFPSTRVFCASNLHQARDLLAKVDFDLALIDLQLPDGSGVEIISLISASSAKTLCIVVTIFADDQHLFPALQAGAGGYLLKDMPDKQFIRRLRSITEGEPPLSPAIARRLITHFGQPQTDTAHNLSSRECEVLALIAQGNKLSDVAEALSISTHTAGDHVKNIYRKLNISSRAEATLEAARLGFISLE